MKYIKPKYCCSSRKYFENIYLRSAIGVHTSTVTCLIILINDLKDINQDFLLHFTSHCSFNYDKVNVYYCCKNYCKLQKIFKRPFRLEHESASKNLPLLRAINNKCIGSPRNRQLRSCDSPP
jgi:hypothetical protein